MNWTPTNAFEAIGVPGLSSTADLRRVNERARIRQSMAAAGGPDTTAPVVERLLSDPTHRLQEAAAWYFAFGTAEEANKSDQSGMVPHDQTLAQWHAFGEAAGRMIFDGEDLEAACDATAQLLNNPATWQPLEGLVLNMADVRVDSSAIVRAAEEAAARWIYEGLLALVPLGGGKVWEAAGIVIDNENLTEEILGRITETLLTRAADQLESAAAEFESRAEPLLEQIGENPSVASALRTAADSLVMASQPWAALVDVFDEDPYSGREGHALDRVGLLLRRASISLANHVGDYAGAERLLAFAGEIAQSGSLESSLEQEQRRVRYVHAFQETMSALQAGDIGRAEAHLVEVRDVASTAEEQAEAAQLQTLIRQRAGAGRQPQRVAASSGSGCGTIIGVLVLSVIALGVVGAIVGSGGDSSNSPSSSDIDLGVVPAGNGDSSFDSTESERLAIERERSRLEGVSSDLDALTAEIYQLARSLDDTTTRYPNGAPGYIVDQYDADRRRHNRLVAQYNDMLADYQTDVEALDRRIDAYNAQ